MDIYKANRALDVNRLTCLNTDQFSLNRYILRRRKKERGNCVARIPIKKNEY